jgi:hypothetical protein
MTQSEAEEDGSDGESGDEEQSEEGHDEVEVVKGSGSRASATPILRLPERNEEDTRWTRADGTKPASAKNKLTVEDMARVCKRKELLWKEVAKNEQDSLVDRWLRDQVKPERWDHIAAVFPQRDKYLPQHKWMLMPEDTKSPIPIRYQQYGITVKLNPDKEDRLHQTFLSLPKTYPTLWICCAHYDCMQVYDVTNFTDTQRNVHLAEHHILGLKKLHGHKALHGARLGKMADSNAAALKRNMPIARLAQLRVARFFIRKMRPFSECEDPSLTLVQIARKRSTNWRKSMVGCGSGVFRTECTVPWLNAWAPNWIAGKHQTPRPGSSLIKFIVFAEDWPVTPPAVKLSRTFNKSGSRRRGTRCRKRIWSATHQRKCVQ